MGKFRKVFRRLRDPRAPNAKHELLEIVFIALAALLCGAESAVDMEEFGRSKEPFLRSILRLQHGIPSHDTFSRVFRLLDPHRFEQAFRRFITAFAKFNRIKLTGVIAVDGKALRGAYERGRSATPMQIVNVFATEARVALASIKAPGRNEAEGALKALKMLCLKHCIVTADALHCSRKFANTVLTQGGDYVLAVKRNQSKLFAAIAACFARRGKRSSAEWLEPSTHDRRESRRATVMHNKTLRAKLRFPGIAAIARIRSRRRVRGAPADKPVIRYYVLSKYIAAKKLLGVARRHWAIENQLHWVLDVVFDEDASRSRKDNAPENLAILRKFAINAIRCHPAPISMRLKRKRAGWDDSFLAALLGHMR